MRIKSNSKKTNLTYVKFDYSRENSAAPELLEDYHELDKDGWTTRIVTIYRDGRYGLATIDSEQETVLPEASIYPLSELDLEKNHLYEITKEQFKEVWNKALANTGNNKT